MNKLFFLHTHYVPKAIIEDCCLAGAVIVPDFYADLNKYYWGTEKSFTNVVDYLHNNSFIDLMNTQIIFSIENINMINDLSIIPVLKEHGVKVIQLFHGKDNRYFTLQNGLSLEGIKLLKCMEKSELILDLSHIPDEHIYKILESYDGRIIVSHCACSDLYKYDSYRSNSLKRSTFSLLSNRKVLFGIAFINDIISAFPYSNSENDDILLNDLVEQITYISSIVGVSQIALGPDFIDLLHFSRVFGVNLKISKYLNSGYGFDLLRASMRGRGFKDKDIDNVYCDNAIEYLRL